MIVPMLLNHIGEVEAIERESFSDPWSKQSFFELLCNPFAVCFSAIDTDSSTNEQVVGYIIIYHVFTEGQILNIAVKDTHRGQKIATELFNTVLEYAQKEKIESITLEVRPSNSHAVGLYKKFGFKQTGIRKNYYKKPLEDAAIMTLIL